ncbi:MAG: N-acetyl-gamma-glutamyl-phosphate reductase [Promicromonosporaceae bacterium]|nr:N-acetyl-gamma-glutamyl-phosphate reductase [Promicromonosporaceae bacterium]
MQVIEARRIRVAVAGASGYAGGEVLRLAVGHPNLEIGALTAHANAGARLGGVHPHLRTLANRVLEPTTPEVLAGHDVVVLALPHGASGEIAAQLPDDVLVLDLGADHRLIDPEAWQQFYGSEWMGVWPYGMPELICSTSHAVRRGRDLLVGVKRIAVPGCNVTAVTLGLQPGIAEGVIEQSDLVAVLVNGYSGAGKGLKAHLLAAEGLGAAAPYAVGGTHRHIPEITQNLQIAAGADAEPVTISFTPTLVPMSRGILATATGRLTRYWLDRLAADTSPGQADTRAAIRQVWCDAYADELFVQVLPEGQWPSTAMTLGANTALIQVVVDTAAGRIVTVTAIDNLVKGTAGAAIQSLNIALGLPETTGLTTEGIAP